MLRNIMITGTAVCLSMGSGLARADHDDELRYVVGGAIIGAALGELAYSTGYRGHVVVDYGYRPYRVYPPRFRGQLRGFRPGYRGHGLKRGHGFRHRHHYDRHRFRRH
jgi:hypothetical protein